MHKQLFLIITIFTFFTHASDQNLTASIVSHTASPKDIRFFLKAPSGENFANFHNLKTWLGGQNKQLLFAMNGGMYLKDLTPQGLYIENGKIIKETDTTETAYGNFYMQPNGIFYITQERRAAVVATKRFIKHAPKNIAFATQSGPMLLNDGKIHPKFMPGSKNLHIRNGVGILPDGKLLFAISKERINFYDFASFFKQNGCQNALYLDGFVSRIYLPQKNIIQYDSRFGVIIAEIADEEKH